MSDKDEDNKDEDNKEKEIDEEKINADEEFLNLSQNEIQELLSLSHSERGIVRYIPAIQRYREFTGKTLTEAKDYIERLFKKHGIVRDSYAVPLNFILTEDEKIEKELSNITQLIPAIKRYRELTGKGIKESKDYVDKLFKIRKLAGEMP